MLICVPVLLSITCGLNYCLVLSYDPLCVVCKEFSWPVPRFMCGSLCVFGISGAIGLFVHGGLCWFLLIGGLGWGYVCQKDQYMTRVGLGAVAKFSELGWEGKVLGIKFSY